MKAPQLPQPRGEVVSVGSLKRWRRRLTPSTVHDTWRGRQPRLQQQQTTPHLLQGIRPFIRVQTPTNTQVMCLQATPGHTLLWPLRAPRSLAAGATVRLQSLITYVLRGLGGLCRLKLRFKGKSFKWHRRHGALLLRFGHAHLVALRPSPGVRWRRFGRMKIILYGADWWGLLEYARAVCWWRPVNVYHGRGLRLRRQVVLRKAGKVSAYR